MVHFVWDLISQRYEIIEEAKRIKKENDEKKKKKLEEEEK